MCGCVRASERASAQPLSGTENENSSEFTPEFIWFYIDGVYEEKQREGGRERKRMKDRDKFKWMCGGRDKKAAFAWFQSKNLGHIIHIYSDIKFSFQRMLPKKALFLTRLHRLVKRHQFHGGTHLRFFSLSLVSFGVFFSVFLLKILKFVRNTQKHLKCLLRLKHLYSWKI